MAVCSDIRKRYYIAGMETRLTHLLQTAYQTRTENLPGKDRDEMTENTFDEVLETIANMQKGSDGMDGP